MYCEPEKPLTKTWVDSGTGKPIPTFDYAAYSRSNMGMGGGMGSGVSQPMLVESPERATFMLLAHTLLALIFAWPCAKFAVRVYKSQHPAHIGNEQSVASKP